MVLEQYLKAYNLIHEQEAESDNWESCGSLKPPSPPLPLSQWHTPSNMATPLKPSQIVLPAGNLVFKYMSPFSFKLPHLVSLSSWHSDWSHMPPLFHNLTKPDCQGVLHSSIKSFSQFNQFKCRVFSDYPSCWVMGFSFFCSKGGTWEVFPSTSALLCPASLVLPWVLGFWNQRRAL